MNENKSHFPDWVNPNSHNSLVGCMLCQQYCPENKKLTKWIENTVPFTESETKQILTMDKMEYLSIDLRKKIKSLDLIETHISFYALKRNLKALLIKGTELSG